MFRRELLILASVAAILFLGVAGLGWLAVKQLRDTSTMLVTDTLPGLVDAGTAAEIMRDNRFAMRQMLLATNVVERAALLRQVQANRTDGPWRDYAASIYEVEDRRNYQALMESRRLYLAACQHFFDLVDAGNIQAASVFFDGGLAVSFQHYNDAAKTLFNYNVRQGTARGERMLQKARYAPLAIAAVTLLVFLLGLILGTRSALSGPANPVRPPRRV